MIDDLDDPLRQSIQISREDQATGKVWFAEHQRPSGRPNLRWLRPQDRLALVCQRPGDGSGGICGLK